MKGPETRLGKKIKKELEVEFPGIRLFKIHGGPFQESGIPDYLGCYKGLFIGLEIKQPGEEPEPIQAHRIREIQKAGGIAGYATSPEQAISIVRRGIRDKEKKTSHRT